MIPKTIDTSTPIHPLFVSRYSGVCFDSSRPVEQQQLLALAEAARWSPSCYGDQPWRFIICDKNTNPESWNQALDCLLEGNRAWCVNAPVLIITCCDTLLSKNDNPNRFCEYDSGAAALAMSLQAASMGLMTHQMGGFVADKAVELFAIPERFKALSMMALGYQLPPEQLPENFREKELSGRVRKPVQESSFAGTWGKGLA